MIPTDEPPRQMMMKLCSGFLLERGLYAVAKLQIADHLSDGPKTALELSKLVGVDPSILHRILRALAGLGVFHQGENNAFSLTLLGEYLRSDKDNSVRPYVLFYHEFTYQSAGAIMSCLESDRSGFEEIFGKPFFEYFKENPDGAEHFNTMISENSRMVIPAILDAYDFSDCGRIVDVGGGTGALLSEILAENTGLSGVLVDLASAVEAAMEGAGGPLPNCELVVGDFFSDDLPRGDTFILKSILHDWDDTRATTILNNCRRASEAGTRFLIIERLVGPANQLGLAHYYDLNMMIVLGAQERTEDEFRSLLKESGFRLERAIPTNSPFHILEAFAA